MHVLGKSYTLGNICRLHLLWISWWVGQKSICLVTSVDFSFFVCHVPESGQNSGGWVKNDSAWQDLSITHVLLLLRNQNCGCSNYTRIAAQKSSEARCRDARVLLQITLTTPRNRNDKDFNAKRTK